MLKSFVAGLDKRHMAVLLLLAGGMLAISPAGLRRDAVVTPDLLAQAITSKTDHVTAEFVAERLIDKDPNIVLVDVRSPEEYQAYHISEAVNIPLARIFDGEFRPVFESGQTVVLYSNGGTHAAQAWVLLTQMGFQTYEMLGGLNYWADAILNPQPPKDLAADPELLNFQFRQAASGYFKQGGEVQPEQKTESAPAPALPNFQLPTRKKGAGKGC